MGLTENSPANILLNDFGNSFKFPAINEILENVGYKPEIIPNIIGKTTIKQYILIFWVLNWRTLCFSMFF